jgi:hypothetical protein
LPILDHNKAAIKSGTPVEMNREKRAGLKLKLSFRIFAKYVFSQFSIISVSQKLILKILLLPKNFPNRQNRRVSIDDFCETVRKYFAKSCDIFGISAPL